MIVRNKTVRQHGRTGDDRHRGRGIAILWYGGHRVMEGKLTFGELMFFGSLLSYLLVP
jgi:hypothetical protein